MSGPLSQVFHAIVGGAHSRTEIAEATSLDPEVVDASLDHLIRMGRLSTEQLGSGCPDEGCTTCSSGRADGSAGCGAAGPANARGPVIVKLSQRPE